MVNKKIGIVLALAALGLAGCGSTTSSASKAATSSTPAATSSTPATSVPATSVPATSVPATSVPATSVPGVDIPTRADNFTFYFHFKASDTVKSLEKWTSPYIDGVFNSWNAHPGVEMTALAGSDVYYCYVPKADVSWEKNANDLGYQLCLGYNATSGVGASMQGVAGYTYKSDFSTNFSGVSHPVWATKGAAVPDTDLIDLRAYTYSKDQHVWDGAGDDFMTFKAQPVEPVVLKNYQIAVDLTAVKAAAPTHVTDYMVKGSYDGWAKSKSLVAGTGDYLGKYIIDCGDVIAGAQIQFCVAPVTLAITEVTDAYIFTTATFGDSDVGTFDTASKNAALTPLKLDGDNHVASWGAYTVPEGYVWPIAPVAMTEDVTITLSNSGKGALATGTTIYVAGSWNGWSADAANAMTANTDGTYSYVIPAAKMFVNVELQFGIITNSDWKGKLVAADTTDPAKLVNFAFRPAEHMLLLDVAGDFALLGVTDAAGTLNYHGAYIPAGTVITIDFVNSGTGALATGVVPCIPGAFDSWNNATAMTANGAKWSYTITATAKQLQFFASYEFKITPTGTWDGAIAGAAGANLSFAIADIAKLTVTVSGDYALLGAAGGVGTVTVA
jgi:hypothetical protein